MPLQEEYKVQLEVFEGPLDLLLYLIKKEEVDIYNIPIETVTTQYMEYLNLMRMLDLNIAGEFLVMAATLMMIKSRMLLPVEDRLEMEDEEDDPRWELVKQLLEYKKFKDIATNLQERELSQEGVFGLGGEGAELGAPDSGLLLEDVSLFDLITAFNNVLKKAKEEEIGEIFGERFTVADKIDAVILAVKEKGQISFSSLFNETTVRHEIVCIFLALLELIRLRQIRISQLERFGEIIIMAPESELDNGGMQEAEAAHDIEG
jgi:segregation and condensation protein A